MTGVQTCALPISRPRRPPRLFLLPPLAPRAPRPPPPSVGRGPAAASARERARRPPVSREPDKERAGRPAARSPAVAPEAPAAWRAMGDGRKRRRGEALPGGQAGGGGSAGGRRGGGALWLLGPGVADRWTSGSVTASFLPPLCAGEEPEGSLCGVAVRGVHPDPRFPAARPGRRGRREGARRPSARRSGFCQENREAPRSERARGQREGGDSAP